MITSPSIESAYLPLTLMFFDKFQAKKNPKKLYCFKGLIWLRG